jgi:hypothetical protein
LIIDVGKPFGWDLPESDKDPYEWLRQFGSVSYCVHLQQTDKTGDRHWPFTKTYNDIGLVEPTKVIEAIESSGAEDCCLILELSHSAMAPDAQIIEDHKISVKYWKDALGL